VQYSAHADYAPVDLKEYFSGYVEPDGRVYDTTSQLLRPANLQSCELAILRKKPGGAVAAREPSVSCC
jgi:hypothetical protein